MKEILLRSKRLVMVLTFVLMLFTKVKSQSFTESFNDISTLAASGWHFQNLSSPSGTLSWFQGDSQVFSAYSGAANAYLAVNFNSTGSLGTISNWMLTPVRQIRNGDQISFYTQKAGGATIYPDRLELRLSTNGSSTNLGTSATSVGDFTTLLLSVNPTLSTSGYPFYWAKYTATVTGLSQPVQGRFAFRYFVTNGGNTGANSDYIGIDELVYTAYQCPSADVVLNSQADVNNFGITYRYCNVIAGNLTIEGNDIVDLTPLQYITDIQGKLIIKNNAQLSTLNGLQQINPATLNGLEITNNASLTYCNLTNFCTYLSDTTKLRTISGNSGACFDETTLALACVPCPSPANLTVQKLLSNAVKLTWAKGGDETNWTMVYGPAGFDPQNSGTTLSLSGDPVHLLTGLTPGTAYQVYIKANCNTYSQSQWVGPVSFTTPVLAPDAEGIMYVTPTGAGNHSGQSWDNAFGDLREALLVPGVKQVWVAAGTYFPSLTNSSWDNFRVPTGVKLIGGFNGTETSATAASPQLNPTILSGELGSPTDPDDNANYVIVPESPNGENLIDGFTITNAKIGLLVSGNSNSTLKVDRCIFQNNSRMGIFHEASSAVVRNISVNNTIFTNNDAGFFNSAQLGGTSYSELSNCIFYGNSSTYAAAVWNQAYGSGQLAATKMINSTVVNHPNSYQAVLNVVYGNQNGSLEQINTLSWNNSSNNSTIDPLFINLTDPDGPDNIWLTADDGLQLSKCSPAINAGVNTDAPATDVLGNPIAFDIRDLGAYENTVSSGAVAVGPIDGAEPTLEAGQQITLTNPVSGGVWKSSIPAVANVSYDGILKGLTSGTATITYTVSNQAGCTAVAQTSVSVTANPLISLADTCTTSTLTIGGTKNRIGTITLLKDGQPQASRKREAYYNEATTVAGGYGQGSAANQLLGHGTILVDADQNVYVCDWGNHRVQKWTPGATSGITVAGGNGLGAAANQLNHPQGMAFDDQQNLIIADLGNHRVQKWLKDPNSPTGYASSGTTIAGGNGAGIAANQINQPYGITLSVNGDMYIADTWNNRIQKWAKDYDSSTGYVQSGTTVAGNSFGQAGITNSELYRPYAVFVDETQNLYITDYANHRVQKWTPGANSGTTVAGGNGLGSESNQFRGPYTIFVDFNGDMYIADGGNHRIQKWIPGATSGITVAGGKGAGNATDQLSVPQDVLLMADGTIYVSDVNNARVQRFSVNEAFYNFTITEPGVYTAEVTYDDGTTYFTNELTFDPQGPEINFDPNTVNIQKDVTISNIIPIVDKGSNNNLNFTISPALPSGLTFDQQTAVISGKLLVQLSGEQEFEIIATNCVGSDTTKLTLNYINAPTDISLSANSINENNAIGAVVATLSSTDIDPGDNHNYTLVGGTGSTDNASFTISGNQLKAAIKFNYELKSSYSLRIRTTDAYGLTFEKVFTITINNTNDAPSNISLSHANLFEGNIVGAMIGTLTSTDEDPGDTHSYTLVGGDVSAFSVSGNQLKAAVVYNHDTKNSYTLTIRSTDSGGLSYDKTFTISISRKPGVFGTSTPVNRQSLPETSTTPVISKGYSSNLKVVGDNLVSYSWSPATGLSSTNSANPVATPNQTTTYTVTVTNAYGSTTTVSITVTVVEDYNVTANNILTPNGDGQNDTWVVENLSTYPEAEVKVFDKAGRLVYSKRGYMNDWNGQYNGNPLATDTYYYIITFGSGQSAKKGYITIVNNP